MKIKPLLTSSKTILGAIIALAFMLRFWGLDHNPPSLNWDEVSHGYNAFSILKTGRDEWGAWFPSIFRAFGDYKLPVYIYLTTLPVAIFGLNAFARVSAVAREPDGRLAAVSGPAWAGGAGGC